MDLFSRGVGNLRQGFQQKQSDSISRQQSTSQMPQVSKNLGTPWNMAGMNASYSLYSDSVLPNQNFNSYSSYGYGTNPDGANAMGFSQAMSDQSSNSLLYGHGANTMGLYETVTNQCSNSDISSNSHSPQFGKGGARDNQSGGNSKNFRQPLLPTPNPTDTPSDSRQTNVSSIYHLSQYGKGGARENLSGGSSKNFRQPLLPTPPTSTTLDYHQTMARDPTINLGSILGSPTMANESSGIQSSELSLGRSRKRARKPRNLRTTNTSSIPTINFSYSPDTSDQDGRTRPMPGGGHAASNSSRFGGNAPNSRQYDGNHSVPKSSQRDTLPNPNDRGDQPVLDVTKFGGRPPVPDGTTSVKYPAPYVKNLLFDSSTGYRFDPTTGLHYDANSGFYLNHNLNVLLRWDALTSTYVLVSNNTSGLATPAFTLLNKTRSPGSLTAGLSPEGLKALAKELAPLLKSVPQEPDPHPVMRSADLYPRDAKKSRRSNPERQIPIVEADFWESREPKTLGSSRSSSPDDLYQGRGYAIRDHMWEGRRAIPANRTCDDRRDPIPSDRRWDDRRDPIPAERMFDDRRDTIPADQKWVDRYDPIPIDRRRGDRRDPIPAERIFDNRQDPIPADCIFDNRRDPIPAHRMWDDKRDPIPADLMRDDRCDTIAVGRAWDVRRDMIPSRRSRSPVRGSRRSPSWERELSMSEIHEHNLKDLSNLYGRYFPQNPSPSSFLLVAPVPSKNEMSRQDVAKYLEDVISSEKLAFRSIRVYQGGFGAPCNYAMIRFINDDAALYWYKLHRGIIELRNYRAAYPTFLFFAEDHWICSKQRDDDKGCDTPTPNFPYRNLCYKCFELRTKLESPIMKMESPTKWIGISGLDCTIRSVADVLKTIPSHTGITIESTEFLREPSGLPIGLCVFQILDREQSTRFFEILKSGRFDVSYIHLNKKALDSAPALSDRSLQRGRETALSRIGPKLNASLPSREKPALPARLRPGSRRARRAALLAARRRKRQRKSKSRQELIENLGEHFLVVDECKESENNEEKTDSEPFLKPKPQSSLLNQLKNVVSVHTLNSGDPDNVIRGLFIEPPSLKAVLLLAPVPAGPGGDKDLVKKDIENILNSDGVQFNNVGVFQGKGLGAPCNYGLIHFNKPCDSLSLYNKHNGFLHLNDGTNDQIKAFMYFSDKNWKCLHCKYVNFPLRTWCNKCFKNRDKRIFSAISVTHTPTNVLGISSIGLPLNMPETSFTTDSILARLPEEESNRVVSCKMMLGDKGLPGLCVLEAKDSNDCEDLLKHFNSTGWRASFLQMNYGTSDMGSVKDTSTDAPSIVAPPEQKGTVRSIQDSSKYDPMKHIFDNSKPSQCIILSPAPALNWDKVKERMDNLLEEDGVNYSCSYDACRPEVCGSPHDYIQISFIDLEKAVSWFRKHDGSVELVFPRISRQKELKFKMFLYYAENAWRCRACLTANFPARSLCHKCYAHRDEDGFTPVTISKTPTKWVGISGLRQTIYNVEQVKKALPLLDSFQITRMHLIKEPNPLLHVGLCVIETPNKEDGLNLAVYIQNHQAMNYEKKSMMVIFVNFNQQPGEESCKQHPKLDTNTSQNESSLPLINFDDSFSNCQRNDSSENYDLYWQNIIKGVEEGEDMLKNYFQDQFIMPLPAGNSVFAQLPSMRQIVGSTQASQFRKVFVSLLEKSGVDLVTAERSKLYAGKNVGGPCCYSILPFKKVSDADAWRAKHNGKWVIDLEDGSKWVSFLHPCNPNWKCKKCSFPNFPLRLHCFSCYESRDGGDPAVTTSDVPSRFLGITRFQNWCATEEILFENIKILKKMREDQQLKEVHYLTEPSGISLGICVLELENTAIAKNVFIQLMAWTQKKHAIVYVDGKWLYSKCKTT